MGQCLSKHYSKLSLNYPLNSLDVFRKLEHLNHPILLDSCSSLRKIDGIDIISAAPYLRFEAYANQYQIFGKTGEVQEEGFDSVKRIVELEQNEPGSLMGYFGYHCLDHQNGIKAYPSEKKLNIPDISVGFYPWLLYVDHKHKKSELRYLKDHIDKHALNELCDLINDARAISKCSKTSPTKVDMQEFAESNFSKLAYLEAFHKVQNYIQAGDCYQVNLAQRFKQSHKQSAWDTYTTLRGRSPAPYCAYLKNTNSSLLSFSPESFIHIDKNGKIVSAPIKGTIKRDSDPTKDADAKQSLCESKKDKAENLMIVDLLRNDLSKNAELKSVKVDSLFDIESFANVHHMVSKISAQKLKDKSELEVLLDCFPGGSITGAPKKRAMEIIRELEPNDRAVYCGAIGYIGFEKELEFNIAIRSILIKDEKLYCWGGGGLVSDSEGDSEHQEGLNKINNLISIKPH